MANRVGERMITIRVASADYMDLQKRAASRGLSLNQICAEALFPKDVAAKYFPLDKDGNPQKKRGRSFYATKEEPEAEEGPLEL
jgi:hypothetical protein